MKIPSASDSPLTRGRAPARVQLPGCRPGLRRRRRDAAIWHMITNDVEYTDLGGDYYTRRNPDRTKKRALAQLR